VTDQTTIPDRDLPHQRRTLAVGEWRPMSADRIREHRFRDTPIGRRGYRPDEVDAFLNRIAGEVQQWTTAYADAHTENNRLRDYYREHPIDAVSIRDRALSTEAITILANAQQQADQLIADAQTHARTMQTDARAQAEHVAAARRSVEHAAHAYRARAGTDYSADREQVERVTALGRSILAALTGATTQLDGASAQMRAVSDAFHSELTKLSADPRPQFRSMPGRAQPHTGGHLPEQPTALHATPERYR
jgi:DivIVA domain-containing protein